MKKDQIDELLSKITPIQQRQLVYKLAISAKIGRALEAKGWTKKELATALNLTPPNITRFFSGTHNFTLETLLEIEYVLDINLINVSDE